MREKRTFYTSFSPTILLLQEDSHRHTGRVCLAAAWNFTTSRMPERKRKVPPISESNRNASRMSESKRERIDINWLDRHPDILKNYVHDQGRTQVCWAFAVAFCVSMLAVIQFGVPGNGNWMLSVQELVDRVCQVYDREKIQGYKKDVLNMGKEFVFKQDQNGTYGALTAYAFIYCKEFGLSYGYKYPFVWRRNMGKSMPSEDEVPRIYISNYKILKGYALEHMVEILDSLEKQPLVGKLYSTPEFKEALYYYGGRASGIENITRIGDVEIPTDAHSVVILGYFGRLNAFLILNSWGENFGYGGLFLVSSKLLFDVGWPELAFRENTVCKFACTPRKRQFCVGEHIVVGSSNILASTKQDANAKPMEVTKNGSVKQSIAKSKVEGSSSDDSDSDCEDDEESVNKAPVVALAAKLMDVSSDESDSEDSSDSDDDELIVKASVKQVPVGAVSKKGTATTKKKVESSDDSDSDDSSSSDDDSPAPNAALSKRPSSTTASKKKLSTKEVDNKEDSSSESEEEEPKKKKLKVQPTVLESIEKESSSEEDDSEEESSDDDASKEEEEEKKILKTPKKKDADVVMGDAESVKTETKKAPQTPRGPQVVATGTKTLFVGNLSFSIQRGDMEAFFKDLGEVADVRFALGGDENFKGFGHVAFATFEAAQAAMELNGRNLSGRPVRFNFAWDRSAYTPSSSKGNSFQKGGRTRVHTIFVRGFDTSGDENNIRSALKKHFETCGDISRISVPKDYESGAVKGFASMDFMDNDGFNQALELDGSEFGESYLNVEEAKPRGDGGGDSRDGRTSGRFGNSSNGDRFGSHDGGDRSRGGCGGRSDQGRTRGRGRGGPTRPSMATVGTGKKTVFDD